MKPPHQVVFYCRIENGLRDARNMTDHHGALTKSGYTMVTWMTA